MIPVEVVGGSRFVSSAPCCSSILLTDRVPRGELRWISSLVLVSEMIERRSEL